MKTTTQVGTEAHLALEVRLSLDLSLLLEPVDNILVSPSDLVRDSLQGAVLSSVMLSRNVHRTTHLPAWLETEDSESSWDDNLLDLVLGWWDTLEQLQTLKGGGTTSGLVGNHSSDGLEEDPRWGAEVEGTGTGRVDNVSL